MAAAAITARISGGISSDPFLISPAAVADVALKCKFNSLSKAGSIHAFSADGVPAWYAGIQALPPGTSWSRRVQ